VRPSVTEQLQGLRRILEDVIAPELTDSYPRDILAGVCATLETIAEGWQQVPAFLDWDARESAALVARLDFRSQGGEVTETVEPADPYDLVQLEVRHRESRAALENAIPAIAVSEDLDGLRTDLAEYFRERAARYPLKMTGRR
jgi:hypothetical protein